MQIVCPTTLAKDSQRSWFPSWPPVASHAQANKPSNMQFCVTERNLPERTIAGLSAARRLILNACYYRFGKIPTKDRQENRRRIYHLFVSFWRPKNPPIDPK